MESSRRAAAFSKVILVKRSFSVAILKWMAMWISSQAQVYEALTIISLLGATTTSKHIYEPYLLFMEKMKLLLRYCLCIPNRMFANYVYIIFHSYASRLWQRMNIEHNSQFPIHRIFLQMYRYMMTAHHVYKLSFESWPCVFEHIFANLWEREAEVLLLKDPLSKLIFS